MPTRRKNICPECGIDKRFRLLAQDKVDALQAKVDRYKKESADYKFMYENKCKVADSLAARLAKKPTNY